MILVDTRAGSNELIDPLRAAGLPVEEATLEFGDVAFAGRGEKGAPLFIGLEHKKFPDLVQSLITDRLCGHQLPGLLETYDRAYLVIEGEWDADDAGRIITPSKLMRGKWTPLKGAMPAVDLEKRVWTLETRGGLRVRWTPNQKATVRYLTAMYRSWSDKDLDEHRSHLAIHAPDLDSALLTPVSNFRKGLVGLVHGLGLVASKAIEQRVFNPASGQGSMRRLTFLSEKELADIEVVSSTGTTKRLGPARAKKVMEALD